MCSEGWGRTQFSLRVWPLGFCPFANEYMHNTNWTWYIPTCFSFSFVGRAQGWRVDLGRLERVYNLSDCIV